MFVKKKQAGLPEFKYMYEAEPASNKKNSGTFHLCYGKVSLHTYIHTYIHIYIFFSEESVKEWQRKRTQTNKGRTTKEYFPDVSERLKIKLQLTQNITTVVSGHGKTRDYLHRFKIIEEQTCSCGEGIQTTDHIKYECKRLKKERDRLKRTVIRTNRWPITKRDLIRRHYKEFTKFINDIQFDKLNVE